MKTLIKTLFLFTIFLQFHFEGKPVLVNVEDISAVVRNDSTTSKIMLNQRNYVLVNETVEQVIDTILKSNK